MADKLKFSLVSPEAELFSGEVDQVDIPGTEGDMGILPDHSPVMAAIRTGAIKVTTDGSEALYFVQGGFADVTPDGLTVLAERAMPMGEVSRELIDAEIKTTEGALEGLEGEALLLATQNLEGLNSIAATI